MPSEQIINDIYKQIDVLARRIERLQNNAAPTVPIYDPTNFPQDAVEGQIALGTDDSAWKFFNGTWKKLGGGLAFDTYPQDGEWFYAKTTDETGSPFGYSFYWDAASLDGSSEGTISMGIPGGPGVDIGGFGGISLRASFGPLLIRSQNEEIQILDISGSGPGLGAGIQVTSLRGDIDISANDVAGIKGGTFIAGPHGTVGFGGLPNTWMEFQMDPVTGLTLVDKTGNPILQIVYNGVSGLWDFLMQTGTTWQAVL